MNPAENLTTTHHPQIELELNVLDVMITELENFVVTPIGPMGPHATAEFASRLLHFRIPRLKGQLEKMAAGGLDVEVLQARLEDVRPQVAARMLMVESVAEQKAA